MPSFKVLILKCLLARVDALSTCSVTLCYITTLDNKAVDDAMNATAKEVQLTLLCCTISLVPIRRANTSLVLLLASIFSGAEPAEILGSDWRDIRVELKNDTTGALGTNCELNKDFRVFWHLPLAISFFMKKLLI